MDDVYFRAGLHPQRLTGRDLYLLNHYIERGEVMSLQRKLACSRSTLYRWKMMAAQKFGVRKIEHLFSLKQFKSE
ncbi:hypothetical protein [Enterobacter ludwigii]